MPSEQVRESIYEPDREMVIARIKEAMDTKGFYRAKYRVLAPAGKPQWVFSRGKCYYKDDKPVRSVGCSYNLRNLLAID